MRRLYRSFGVEPPQRKEGLDRYRGTISTYQPDKNLRSGIRLAIHGLFSVVISVTFAQVLSWFTPSKGFNCHSVMELVVFAIWVNSAIITWWTWQLECLRKYHFHLLMVKDVFVSAVVMVMNPIVERRSIQLL